MCGGVAEPPPPWAGRRPVPLADRIYAWAHKVYIGLSSRRFARHLAQAHEQGYLSRPLHHSKVCHFLCEPDLTAPLRKPVARSALPPCAVETDFAVDSSGFPTSRDMRWMDEKHGVEQSGHDWVKVHVCTGVKTNIVTDVESRGRDAADSPLLPPLVRATAESFKIGEVGADKGYLSAEIVETIAALGGVPFIAPKANTTGGVGGLFEEMYHYYGFRRDEFLKHYHKRSNVESAFSAVKRTFGDGVRSRDDPAMVNGALCKLLCHNLRVVIASQVELGTAAEFWPERAIEPRDVLPLVTRR